MLLFCVVYILDALYFRETVFKFTNDLRLTLDRCYLDVIFTQILLKKCTFSVWYKYEPFRAVKQHYPLSIHKKSLGLLVYFLLLVFIFKLILWNTIIFLQI